MTTKSPLLYEVNLIPAYGRNYTTPAQVLAAWNAGKDFRIADLSSPYNDRYTSRRDWVGKSVRIRFNRLTDFVIIHNELIV